MKGATRQLCGFRCDNTISIHAPVKGATSAATQAIACLYISIHAPVKGATVLAVSINRQREHFNPRSREGSDACKEAGCGCFE